MGDGNTPSSENCCHPNKWSKLSVYRGTGGLNPIPVNEITLSLETLTVEGIQALYPNDNYCPKQPIFQNTAQCVGVAAVSASL